MVNKNVDNFILLLIVPVGFMSNVLCAFLKIVFFCYFCIYNVSINNNHINYFLSLNFSFSDKQSQNMSSYFKFGVFCSSLKALQKVRKTKVNLTLSLFFSKEPVRINVLFSCSHVYNKAIMISESITNTLLILYPYGDYICQNQSINKRGNVKIVSSRKQKLIIFFTSAQKYANKSQELNKEKLSRERFAVYTATRVREVHAHASSHSSSTTTSRKALACPEAAVAMETACLERSLFPCWEQASVNEPCVQEVCLWRHRWVRKRGRAARGLADMPRWLTWPLAPHDVMGSDGTRLAFQPETRRRRLSSSPQEAGWHQLLAF